MVLGSAVLSGSSGDRGEACLGTETFVFHWIQLGDCRLFSKIRHASPGQTLLEKQRFVLEGIS